MIPAHLFVTLCLTASLVAQTQPNIVVVMTDDQGYGDFGVHGNEVLDTNHLDAFAAQCPQVERFYVCPVCSPTRASLMTGRYHYRTRVVDTWIGRSMMDPEEVTIAEELRAAGYRTGIFGKWHLGDCYPMRTMDQGFDVSLIHRGGGLAQPSEPIENGRRYTDAMLVRDGELVETKGYCTDVYFDNSMRFIDEAVEAKQPFFAYIATNAPHDPFHDVPPALLEKYRQRDLSSICKGSKKQRDNVARTFAMIENIDQNFGRLIAHIDELGVADDTIVVFLSDNGPARNRAAGELRGHKGTVYEGGIRTPMWIRWPGKFSPTTKVREIAAHIDLTPTLLDAVGIETQNEHDGRSLAPLLGGKSIDWPDRQLFLQVHRGNEPVAEHHFAVIGRRWKLVRNSGFGKAKPPAEAPFELFDLLADPSERTDVADLHELVVARMRDDYRKWFADVSSTRADNYAPPRIRIGTEHEHTTTLTRQDWRPADGLGWGHAGVWLLHNERARSYTVTLLFREEKTVEIFRVEAGGKPWVEHMVLENDRFELGPIPFAAGDIDLRVTCDNGERFAPYQVLLTPAD